MQDPSNNKNQQQPFPKPAPMPMAGQPQRQAPHPNTLPQTFVPAHSSLTSHMMQQTVAGLPQVTQAAF